MNILREINDYVRKKARAILWWAVLFIVSTIMLWCLCDIVRDAIKLFGG